MCYQRELKCERPHNLMRSQSPETTCCTVSYSNFRDCIDNYIIYTVNSHHCINITAQGDCQTGEGGGAPARHVVTDRETGEVAAIASPPLRSLPPPSPPSPLAPPPPSPLLPPPLAPPLSLRSDALSTQHARAASAYRHGRACSSTLRVCTPSLRWLNALMVASRSGL